MTECNYKSLQLLLLWFIITPEILDSPKVATLIIELIKTRKDVPAPLLRDLNWFIGRQIVQLMDVEEEEDSVPDNAGTSLIMHSDLLSGGL